MGTSVDHVNAPQLLHLLDRLRAADASRADDSQQVVHRDRDRRGVARALRRDRGAVSLRRGVDVAAKVRGRTRVGPSPGEARLRSLAARAPRPPAWSRLARARARGTRPRRGGLPFETHAHATLNASSNDAFGETTNFFSVAREFGRSRARRRRATPRGSPRRSGPWPSPRGAPARWEGEERGWGGEDVRVRGARRGWRRDAERWMDRRGDDRDSTRVNEHDRSLLSERSPRRARPRSTDDRRVDSTTRAVVAIGDRRRRSRDDTHLEHLLVHPRALLESPVAIQAAARAAARIATPTRGPPREDRRRPPSRRARRARRRRAPRDTSSTPTRTSARRGRPRARPPRTGSASSCRASSLSATTAQSRRVGVRPARGSGSTPRSRSAFLCAPRDVASRRREKRSSRDASTDSAAAALSGAGGFPPPNMTSASATRSGDGRREGFIRPLDASTRSCP